jgi:protein tyrosine phosphatase (PTP) superfamily phosphohydrolase (DUF442 family)
MRLTQFVPLLRQQTFRSAASIWVAFLAAVSLISDVGLAQVPPPAELELPRKIDSQHLPNAVWLHPRVISGGLPVGDAAFAELSRRGIKTIISVDGAKPDLAAAQKYGLRYIHLPHGYDGISAERMLDLSKAIRDLDGPIYVHCHHGKHRSPAAAGVACVGAGLISTTTAVKALEVAGTSPDYRGLFQAVQQAQPIDPVLLDQRSGEFPEIAQLPPLAEAMVELETVHDHLQQIMTAGWRAPPQHADLDPRHTALMLREHFSELLRSDLGQQQDVAFRDYLQQSESAARQIETTLAAWSPDSGQPTPAILASSAQRIREDCKACHVRFRDNP